MPKSSPKIYGVLGYPAKHSLSPDMHNAAFQYLKIEAEYRIFEKEPAELDSFFGGLAENNICGLNVTIPYKEEVLKYLAWQSPEVRFTAASNTIIVKEKGYLEGWNTDGIGFHRHLVQDLGFEIAGKKAVLLGAGGASKAIIDQLARNKIREISIYDIDKQRAAALAKKTNDAFKVSKATALDSLSSLDFSDTQLLINATPIGMKLEDPLLVSREKMHSGLLVYDLIYNPAETNLLKEAKAAGAKVANGLGMLLYQGARSFELWTDKIAPIEIMRNALEKGAKGL